MGMTKTRLKLSNECCSTENKKMKTTIIKLLNIMYLETDKCLLL